jgi:hypothetical protein
MSGKTQTQIYHSNFLLRFPSGKFQAQFHLLFLILAGPGKERLGIRHPPAGGEEVRSATGKI